jgi:hypothetical protein
MAGLAIAILLVAVFGWLYITMNGGPRLQPELGGEWQASAAPGELFTIGVPLRVGGSGSVIIDDIEWVRGGQNGSSTWRVMTDGPSRIGSHRGDLEAEGYTLEPLLGIEVDERGPVEGNGEWDPLVTVAVDEPGIWWFDQVRVTYHDARGGIRGWRRHTVELPASVCLAVGDYENYTRDCDDARPPG